MIIFCPGADLLSLSALLPEEISKDVGSDLRSLTLNEEYVKKQENEGLQDLCENSWKDVLVTQHANPDYEDRTIGEINSDNPVEEYLKAVMEDPESRAIFKNMASYDDIEYVIDQPFTMIVSDGYLYDSAEEPKVHPRSFGAISKYIKEFIREGNLGTENGLRKITSLPAEKFSLDKRGYLRPGYYADVSIFDIEKVENKETFERPYLLSEGMEYVFCNGDLIFENDKLKGQNGKFLTGNEDR